ncbi:hypothetical protein [Pseudonocardia sp.]|jgi:hypothetical protein|uniref:hypothetical protein n=1 Tax=Pseudonocardia sp. TaxID=60912 RepID=UPI002D854363|nr:hypothetical protein [Pseudonocardia sp.]
MIEERRPGRVPDEGGPVDIAHGFDVTAGFDTDGDGRSDTAVTDDGVDLVLLTDLDGDGFADQVLRIGPDGVVREVAPDPSAGAGTGVVDGLRSGADAGYEP